MNKQAIDRIERTDEEAPLDVEELQDRYRRALAEVANLSKRLARDVAQAKDIASGEAAVAFLPIVDDLHRALDAIQNSPSGEEAKQHLLDGVKLILARFKNTLETLEIKGFESEGQMYAAELMEAIGQVPSKTLAPGTVAHQLSQGFTRRGKLLRPAQVVVAVKGGMDDD